MNNLHIIQFFNEKNANSNEQIKRKFFKKPTILTHIIKAKINIFILIYIIMNLHSRFMLKIEMWQIQINCQLTRGIEKFWYIFIRYFRNQTLHVI